MLGRAVRFPFSFSAAHPVVEPTSRRTKANPERTKPGLRMTEPPSARKNPEFLNRRRSYTGRKRRVTRFSSVEEIGPQDFLTPLNRGNGPTRGLHTPFSTYRPTPG